MDNEKTDLAVLKRQKFIIALTVFIDVVGLGIVIPTLPFYAERFGSTPLQTTLFFAVFALCSFLSSPFLGALSDRIGRRPVLITSILGTSLGWFIFSFATSLPLLYLGRIIDGITAGNISTAQSYLVDISRNDKERTSNISLIGGIFGLGFIIGPAIGSALSYFGPSTPFLASAFLALFNGIAAYFYLPETLKTKSKEKISLNPFKPIFEGFKNKDLRPLLLSWFLFSLAFSSIQSVTTLYLKNQFGFDEKQSGWILVVFGVIGFTNQIFILRKLLLPYFKEKTLSAIAQVLLVISYLLLSSNLLFIYLIGIVITSLAQSVLRVTNNSMIAGLAPADMKGRVIGTTQAVTSLAAIIVPVVGGLIFEINISWPWLLSSFFMLIALILMLFSRESKHSKKDLELSNQLHEL
jgi:DHA1 family tetracycline resistance protein-like MFS transporter